MKYITPSPQPKMDVIIQLGPGSSNPDHPRSCAPTPASPMPKRPPLAVVQDPKPRFNPKADQSHQQKGPVNKFP